MFGEISIFGVAVPTILGLALVAYLVYLVVKRGLAVFGVYRIVWHPALFDAALFVIALCGVASLSQWVLS